MKYLPSRCVNCVVTPLCVNFAFAKSPSTVLSLAGSIARW